MEYFTVTSVFGREYFIAWVWTTCLNGREIYQKITGLFSPIWIVVTYKWMWKINVYLIDLAYEKERRSYPIAGNKTIQLLCSKNSVYQRYPIRSALWANTKHCIALLFASYFVFRCGDRFYIGWYTYTRYRMWCQSKI